MGADKPLVLVVDDDEIDVVVVERALARLGDCIDIKSAGDGQEALDVLQARDPLPPMTLVLLDLNMHRMNGFGFLESWQEAKNLSRVAVFVMTSSWRRQDMERAYQFPIAGYVVKNENDEYAQSLAALVQGYVDLVRVL